MENSTLEYRIEVMQAYLDGRTIEYDKFNNHYEDCPNPDFNWQFHNYRIKELTNEEVHQKLAEKLLSVFGYTNDSSGNKTEKEAINEIFNSEAGGCPIQFLEMFLMRVFKQEMKELKEIVCD